MATKMNSRYQYKGIFGKGLDYLKGGVVGLGLSCLLGCNTSVYDSYIAAATYNEDNYSAVISKRNEYAENDDILKSSVMGEEDKFTLDVEYKRPFDTAVEFNPHEYKMGKVNVSLTGNVDEHDLDTSTVVNYPLFGEKTLIPGLIYTRDLTRGEDSFGEATTTVSTDSETWGLNLISINKGSRLDFNYSAGDIEMGRKTTIGGVVVEDIEDKVIATENHCSVTYDLRGKNGNVLVDLGNTFGDDIESTTTFTIGGSYNFSGDFSVGAIFDSGMIQSEGEIEKNDTNAAVILGSGDNVSKTIMNYLRSKRASLGWYSTHTDLFSDTNLMFDQNSVIADDNRSNRFYVVAEKAGNESLEVKILNIHSFKSKGDNDYITKLVSGANIGKRKLGVELGLIIKRIRK